MPMVPSKVPITTQEELAWVIYRGDEVADYSGDPRPGNTMRLVDTHPNRRKVVITEVKTWEIRTDEWLSDEDIAGVAVSVVDGEDPDTQDISWEIV